MKKIAYLILAHDDSAHLEKLVNAINYNCDIYIHIDKKSDLESFKSKISLSNVYFIEDRVYVAWAGISMVDALMKLIKVALNKSEDYSHAVFLTGSCYPIKNAKTIHKYFTSKPETEFMRFIDMRKSPEHYMKLILNKWFKDPIIDTNNKFLKKADKGIRFMLTKLKLKNEWNNEITPYFGSTWCALTMNCCEFVHNYHNDNPWFYNMNKYTMASDEHYIHTIVGNSSYLKYCIETTKFKGRGVYKYANFHIIDKSLAKWYTIKDWEEIIESDMLFVRKLKSKVSNELVDRINKELMID